MMVLANRLTNPFRLVVLAGVFWFAANLPTAAFLNGGPPPVLSYIGFIGFGALVALVLAAQGRALVSAADIARIGPALMWIFCWLAWSLANALWSSQAAAPMQMLVNRVEMALILTVLLLLLPRLASGYEIGLVMVAVALIGAAMNVSDFLQPRYTSVPGRAAGFYINPNIAAFVLTQTMVLGVAALPRVLRWPFVGAVAVSIFLTFARSGWLQLFPSVVLLVWSGVLGTSRRNIGLGLAAVLAVGLLGYGIVSGKLVDTLLNTPLAGHLDTNTLARIGMGGFARDHSASERQMVMLAGLQAYVDGPSLLLGHGLGYTFEWEHRVSTHNMFVFYLAEGGALGIVVYAGLIGLSLIRSQGVGRIVAVNVALYSLFSHNILDTPDRLVPIAIVLSRVALPGMAPKGLPA